MRKTPAAQLSTTEETRRTPDTEETDRTPDTEETDRTPDTDTVESVAINITEIEGMSMPVEIDIPVTTDIGTTNVTRDVDGDSESEDRLGHILTPYQRLGLYNGAPF